MSVSAALAPWMAIFLQGATTVEVPVVFSNGSMSPPLVCVRDGDDAWMSAESARRLGWNVSISDSVAKIEAYGRQVVSPSRQIGNEHLFNYRLAVSSLSAETVWREDALWTLARVSGLTVESNKLRIGTTLPVTAKISIVANPPRVVIDISNALIVTSAPPTISGSLRLAQFGEDTVRVVVQTDKTPTSPNLMAIGSETVVSWSGATAVKTEPYKPPAVPLDPMQVTSGNRADEIGPAAANVPLRLGPPVLEKDTPTEVIVSIKYMGLTIGSPEILVDDSGAFVVDLENAGMLTSQQVQIINGQNLRVASLTKSREGVRVRLEFNRVMLARIAGAMGELVIRATPPREALNGIKGAVVALDARKGGKDIGVEFEVGGDKFRECDINADLSTRVEKLLSSSGAKPLQIRPGDKTMTEFDRTTFANTKKAALLVSIGCSNEFEKPTVRYHAKSLSGRLMAASIAAKIPGCEIRTFDSWLLSKSVMPAVIVTVGDIGQAATQSGLSKEDYRQKIAEGIANGIVAFAKGERPSG